jgi:hypothetical protein
VTDGADHTVEVVGTATEETRHLHVPEYHSCDSSDEGGGIGVSG